jgi:hypothetical protein
MSKTYNWVKSTGTGRSMNTKEQLIETTMQILVYERTILAQTINEKYSTSYNSSERVQIGHHI